LILLEETMSAWGLDGGLMEIEAFSLDGPPADQDLEKLFDLVRSI
jgi:hypothetical protein